MIPFYKNPLSQILNLNSQKLSFLLLEGYEINTTFLDYTLSQKVSLTRLPLKTEILMQYIQMANGLE